MLHFLPSEAEKAAFGDMKFTVAWSDTDANNAAKTEMTQLTPDVSSISSNIGTFKYDW